MPAVLLYSAPEEKYLEHITRCQDKFEQIFPIFNQTIMRIFNQKTTTCDPGLLKEFFSKMIIFHDLGKLTRRWQERVGSGSRLPSHSTLGAAYLWKALPAGIREPISFAVTIHHTDRGLLGDNIEKPDIQAITDGITDYSGKINWDERVGEMDGYFPKDVYEININSLKEMARGLRVWAKGCSLLEQHERRLQASITHHILKLCDISAATERKEYKKHDKTDYYGGWLMVENINSYLGNILARNRTFKLKRELERWMEILKNEYFPEKVILFGSFAKSKVNRWSDIDLLILKDTRKSFLDRTKEVLLLLHPKVGVDILVYTPQEFKNLCAKRLFFKREIITNGVTIYERGS